MQLLVKSMYGLSFYVMYIFLLDAWLSLIYEVDNLLTIFLSDEFILIYAWLITCGLISCRPSYFPVGHPLCDALPFSCRVE